jgi:hypothetical protein
MIIWESKDRTEGDYLKKNVPKHSLPNIPIPTVYGLLSIGAVISHIQ